MKIRQSNSRIIWKKIRATLDKSLRNYVWISILLLLFYPGSIAEGAQNPDSQYSPDPSPTDSGMGDFIINWVDLAHIGISKKILQTSERLDSFFGDERVEEETQYTQIKITTSLRIDEGESPALTFPISANLPFPHLKHRLQIVAGTILKENGKLAESDDTNEENIDATISLRYKLLEQARKWVSLDSGVKVYSDTLEPFVSLRVRRVFDFDPWALRFTQFGFWYESEGFGETSRLDFERRLGYRTLLRMTSNGTWSESSEGLNFSQSVYLRWQFSQKRALGLECKGEGHTSPSTLMDSYTAKLTYRQQIYKNWVFFQVQPGLQFLRENDFRLAPFTLFNFELRFGDIPER